jgi:phosphate transport system substrate-binding protein
MEVRQLITDYQDAEGTADGLIARARDVGRTETAEEGETLVEAMREAMARAGRLIPAPTSPPPPAELAKFLAEIKASLDQARTSVGSYAPVPFQTAEATLVIVTTSDLAENLAVPILKARSGGEAVPAPGQVWYYKSKAGHQPEEKVIVRVADALAYNELIEKRADLVLSDVAHGEGEAHAFAKQFPGSELASRAYSEVVALDALTLLAHPESTESDITAEQARVARWIGGSIESPEHATALRFGFQIAQMADRPAEAVLTDRTFRGLGLYHQEGVNIRAKRLAYQAGPKTAALQPSPFTIATEDYKFAFRIIATHSPASRPGALELVNFMTKPEGQAVVAQQGYVDLALRPMGGNADPRILAILARTLGKPVRSAVRLSASFQFPLNEKVLDIKGLADLGRVPDAIAKDFPTASVVILGFTDSSGGPQINGPLANDRGKFVADQLVKAMPGVKSAGLADQLPVDTNDTEVGRARNRRAEVWVVP